MTLINGLFLIKKLPICHVESVWVSDCHSPQCNYIPVITINYNPRKLALFTLVQATGSSKARLINIGDHVIVKLLVAGKELKVAVLKA